MPEQPPHLDERSELRDRPEELRDAADRLAAALDKLGYSEAARFAVRLALEEAVVNAFKHGSAGIDKPIVDVQWRADPTRVTITVADRGPGFDPGGVPDPTSPDRLEVPTGRGLMLMRAYMSEVSYNERGNAVTMTYDTTSPPTPGGED